MKKTFTGLLMGLLCLHHSALAQVFYNVQNQIPVPELVDASQAIQTSGNVADYVFQEVSNVVQGVTINLYQDTPPMPYEIHLQSDACLLHYFQSIRERELVTTNNDHLLNFYFCQIRKYISANA